MRWSDALDSFLETRFDEGLRLARDSRHPDAQWLCSTVPAGDVTGEGLKRAMVAQGEDPRALFMLYCLRDGQQHLRRAAELGYAPAQAKLAAKYRTDAEVDRVSWAEKAAAQQDRNGLFRLGCNLWAMEPQQERTRALALFREAAELEHAEAQYWVGMEDFGRHDWQRYRLVGRAAARGESSALGLLRNNAVELLGEFEADDSPGKVVFELGAALRGNVDGRAGRAYGLMLSGEKLRGALRCVELHDKWCAAAKRSIECWIGMARRLNVAKDIRLLIARLLWDERREWSTRV